MNEPGEARRSAVGPDTGGGQEVTGEVAEAILVIEVNGDTFLQFFPAFASLKAIVIIPALWVETVAHQRRSHNEANLGFGHAGAQLIYHLLCDDIALLNVDAVDTWKLKSAAASE